MLTSLSDVWSLTVSLFRVSIFLIFLGSLLCPNELQAQQLPCAAPLIGMSGYDRSKIENGVISKGTLSKFKACPDDTNLCERDCYKWTPERKDETPFCFATMQHFRYDETSALEDYTAFRFRHKFPYRPNETDDFFWFESTDHLRGWFPAKSEKFVYGINRIGETGSEIPGFLNCEDLGEIVTPKKENESLSYLPARK